MSVWNILQRHDPGPHALERAFPRDNPPNDNPPIGTTGPNVPAGFGDTHVMYPAANPPVEVQAWAGWPVEWQTPHWNAFMGEFHSQGDTAFACLDLNASVLSTMPVYLTRNGATLSPLPWMINPAPRWYTSWEEFAKQLFWSYQLGEAFVYCIAREAEDPGRAPYWDPVANRAPHPSGWPTQFVLLAPWEVNVQYDTLLERRVYSSALTGEEIDPRDLLHIRYASWAREARGHGPLEAGRARLVAAHALTRYGTDLAVRGGIPWAVIVHPDRLKGAQAKELQDQWLASRMTAMGLPAVLSGGITLEALQINPKDMALQELLTFNEARIAVLLGVPPFLVGLPSGGDSMTYSNVSSLFDYHWRASLRPKAQPVMSALTNWATWYGSAVELNRDEYVRPGLAERANAYAVLHGIEDEAGRAITVREIRERERMLGPASALGLTAGNTQTVVTQIGEPEALT